MRFRKPIMMLSCRIRAMYAFRLIYLRPSAATANKNALVPSIWSLWYSSSSSSSSVSAPEPSFPVSYLVNTCGLSPQAAISAAKKVNFTSPDRPDLVLALLRDYGVDNTHIPKLISKLPVLLLKNPDKTLRPKLEFFRNLLRFSSPSQLPKFVVSSPYFLLYSLRDRIIPYYILLKTMLLDDYVVAVYLTHNWVLRTDWSCCLAANVEMLRQVGAPQSVILQALLHSPTTICHKQDKFKAGVEDVIKLGFQPYRLSFIQALDANSL